MQTVPTQPRSNWRRRALSLWVALFVLLGPQVGPARADNFAGPTSATGCTMLNMADNYEHTYYYSGLTSAVSAALDWTRTNNLDPTEMTSVTVSSVTAATDVVAYDADYTTYCGYTWNGSGGSTIGLVTCVSLSGSTCEKHELRFDTSYTSGATVTNRRSLACHENGHTVGLAHRASSDSCMPATLNGVTQYSPSHDVPHINAWF